MPSSSGPAGDHQRTSDDAEWDDLRMKRILVDYMLRMSYYDSATKLAETSGIEVIRMAALS